MRAPTAGMRGALAIALALPLACGQERNGDDTAASSWTGPSGIDTGSSDDDDDDDDDDEDILDVGQDGNTGGPGDEQSCEAEDVPEPNAMLTGRVFAPNMEIPISGALVYVDNQAPEPVPDEVYCAECVELDCDANFVLTNADGTFELPAVAGEDIHLVVQKGQFLRDVVIDIEEGTQAIAPEMTNLPGRWAPNDGMWIPKIAVYQTDPDAVYNVLAKFGLGEVSASGTLVPGTEQFGLISDQDQGAFMDDLPQMQEFHIIFLPCAATKFWLGAPTVSPLRAQNIRDYVAGGGKWYATDHSNEYIKEPFSQYLDLHAPAMPDIQPSYDVMATVEDPDLLAWLEALPPELKDIGGGNPTLNQLPSFETRLNYTGIDAVHEVLVENEDGEEVNVGPYTYVSGPCTSCSDPATSRTMALTGQWGCGRMMYSTFETSSVPHAGLNPQELVLLYMILEIGVCHDKPPPPIPPVG